MKKLIFFLSLCYAQLFSSSLTAQCPSGSVTLTTQAEVDQFAIDYPNCTEINGNLTIGPSGDIENLDGLTGIERTIGYLMVRSNSVLFDLSGLNQITVLDGGLNIYNNSSMMQFPQFNNLTSIGGGSIYISSNPFLPSFDLSGVTSPNLESIVVRSNNSLGSVCLPTNLETLSQNFEINNNPKLSNLCGLPNLNLVEGFFMISSSIELDLPDYNNLTTIGNGLHITKNEEITELPAFNSLASIKGGPIYVGNNSKLPSFDLSGVSAPNLLTVVVRSNPELQSACLPSDLETLSTTVSSLRSHFEIYDNPLLEEICEFNNLKLIQNNFLIAGTVACELPDFPKLESVGSLPNEGMQYFNNSNLEHISALPSLSYIHEKLEIVNNPVLSICAVQAFCDYLPSVKSRTISGNLGACIDENAILNACSAAEYVQSSDYDSDGFSICQGDCDDDDSSIYPGALEICDGKDNDCNGIIDDGTDGQANSICGIDLELEVLSHESCAANGQIGFNTITPSSDNVITYTIYNSADLNTPVGVTQDNNFGGLVAGDYTVVASQTLFGNSHTATAEVTIDYTFEEFDYSIETGDEICDSDATITVDVSSGTLSTIEIISGPMSAPIETSNTLSGLIAGDYRIQITDICGEGYVEDLRLEYFGNEFIPWTVSDGPVSCDLSKVRSGITAIDNAQISYPVTFTYTVHPPSESALPDESFIQIVSSGNSTSIVHLEYIIPSYGQGIEYFYDLEVTDACGFSSSIDNIRINDNFIVPVNEFLKDCNTGLRINAFRYVSPIIIDFLESPLSFIPENFNDIYPGPFTESYHWQNPLEFWSASESMPEGHYKIRFTEDCGSEFIWEGDLENPQLIKWGVTPVATDCNDGEGMVRLAYFSEVEEVWITNAPDTYSSSFPVDVSQYIFEGTQSEVRLTELPEGEYTFEAFDACGNLNTSTVNVPGYEFYGFDYQIDKKCGSFDLSLDVNSNFDNGDFYFEPIFVLQIFNDITQEWNNLDGSIHTTEAGYWQVRNGQVYELINHETAYNINQSGHFRILRIVYNDNQISFEPCERVLAEFDYLDDGLQFTNAYNFLCENNSYNVICEATGVAPLTYKVIEKDNQPFFIDNNTDPVFTDLMAGLYTIEIEDPCGNSRIREVQVSDIQFPRISPDDLCDGESGVLETINLPFLQYAWYKANDPGIILSTSHQLEFTSFSSLADEGEYLLDISYDGAASCIDETLNFYIGSNYSDANAGEDTYAEVCVDQEYIDLNNYLSAEAQENGLWRLNGTIVGNPSEFNLFEATTDLIEFSYGVDGLCNGFDEAQITIQRVVCNQPPVAQCEDVTVSVQEQCNYNSETALLIGSGSYDPDNDPLEFDVSPARPYDVGVHALELTVTDDYGASDTCISNLTVVDDVAPIAVCKDITVTLDELGEITIEAIDIDNSSDDACGIASYAIDVDNFCCTIGARTVVLTVTDVYGNTSSCTSNVFVDGADEDCDSVHDYHDLCNGGDDTVDNDEDGLPDCFYPPIYEDIIDAWKCGNNKVYICHLPPGNPENAQTLCISKNAIDSHIGNHDGDYMGECFAVNCDTPAAPANNPFISFLDEQFVQDQSPDQMISIYPNPSSDWVTVDFGSSQVQSILIFSTAAEVLYKKDLPKSGLIDISEFPAGVYQVVVQTDRQYEIHRLVKL